MGSLTSTLEQTRLDPPTTSYSYPAQCPPQIDEVVPARPVGHRHWQDNNTTYGAVKTVIPRRSQLSGSRDPFQKGPDTGNTETYHALSATDGVTKHRYCTTRRKREDQASHNSGEGSTDTRKRDSPKTGVSGGSHRSESPYSGPRISYTDEEQLQMPYYRACAGPRPPRGRSGPSHPYPYF